MDGNEGMGTSALYDWIAITLSVLALVMSLLYLRRITRAYQEHHDERAAVSLAKAVGLSVVAFGMIVSASGLVLSASVLSVAGLSIARGALVVLLATLLLANIRRSADD